MERYGVEGAQLRAPFALRAFCRHSLLLHLLTRGSAHIIAASQTLVLYLMPLFVARRQQ
jgi:hypothetical protein